MKIIVILFIILITSCSKANMFKDEIVIEEDVSNDEIVDDVFDDEFDDVIKFIKDNEVISKKLDLTIYGATNYKYLKYTTNSNILFEELNIKTNYINISNARPGIIRDIKWIVIHDTQNTNSSADALNHEKYLFNNTDKTTSWHYIVDDKNIINNIPDDEVAYHAGDGLKGINETSYLGGGNLNGIGIEMALNEGNDIILSYHKVAKLTAYLLDRYNLDITRVKYHKDFSGKICPKTLINNNLEIYFMDLVKAELEYIKYNNKYKITKSGNNYTIINRYTNTSFII